MATGTLSASAFGVLAPFLIDEFDITRSQLGLLTTAAFVAGGAGSVPAGGLVDRFGGRRVLTASMALVAVTTLAMAAAPSYAWMLAAAAVSGCAIAAGNPTTNKLVAMHVAPGERGVVMGVKQAGVQMSAFFAGSFLPAASGAFGWRRALAATVIVPVAGALATLRVVPRDARVDASGPRARPTAASVVPWIGAYAFLMGLGVSSTTNYLPLYAREAVGMSVTAGGALTAALGAMGIVSRVAWGWGTERLGRFALPLAVMAAGAAAAALLVLYARTAGGALLWVAALLLGATAVTWNSVGMLAVVAEAGPGDAGRASGWVLTGFYGGFVAGPFTFGLSVDRLGSYAWGWAGVTCSFAIAAAIALAWHAYRRRASR
ncbi:MAG TPA: MFS transporter [Actinomycetota bacterium]|nr:MFS transporter [Actinomycetota bacterium]